MKKLGGLLIIIISLFVSVLLVQSFEDRKKSFTGEKLLFFPSGKFIQGVACGYNNFLADLLWIRGGVYYGGQKSKHGSLEYLNHIFNVITDLDPKFINAYTTGGMFLFDDLHSLEMSMKLLDKGIYNNPTNWYVPFMKGFILYLAEKYDLAYRWFMVASLYETGKGLAFKFANWCLQKEMGPEMTLKFWENIYNTTENRWMRGKAVKGISRVILYAAVKYKRENGEWPENIVVLVKSGYLPYVPSLGGKYFLFKEGEVLW